GLTATEFAEAKLGDPSTNRFGLRGIPPKRVAAKIANAIEHNRTEVYPTPFAWAFTHLNRLFPRTVDWLVTRLVKYA
ncbi:MAG: hypothetical protein KC415_12115, partial [Anaerolineales bacterium]|nr:hypothetical protein [Anaerolineales bacterium]